MLDLFSETSEVKLKLVSQREEGILSTPTKRSFSTKERIVTRRKDIPPLTGMKKENTKGKKSTQAYKNVVDVKEFIKGLKELNFVTSLLIPRELIYYDPKGLDGSHHRRQ